MQKIQSLRCVRSGIGEDCTHAEAALAKRVMTLKNLVIFLKGCISGMQSPGFSASTSPE